MSLLGASVAFTNSVQSACPPCCNYLNASTECEDVDHPLHIIAAQFKQAIVELIRTQLTQDADYIALFVE